MSNLNRVFQYVHNMFNFKTYIEGKGYMTANLIELYERYYRLYCNYSEYEKFDLWTTIKVKWLNTFTRKRIAELNRNAKKFGKRRVFIAPQPYTEIFDIWYHDFMVNFKNNYSTIWPHNESNYQDLYFIYQDYLKIIDFLNSSMRNITEKIKVGYAPSARSVEWIESKEIIPGHYSDITRYQPNLRQNYIVHPAQLYDN